MVSLHQLHGTVSEEMWSANTLEKAQTLLKHLEGTQALTIQHFSENKFSTAESSKHIDSYEPKSGKRIARIPCASADEVDAAVQAAKKAFPAWSKTPRAERSRLLRRVSDIIAENRELFAVWESIDQGKTLERARIEVDRAVSNFSYFSTFILHESTSARMIDNTALTYEHRSPTGVFALISPWNMPLYLLTWKIAPCLAFGCTAVAKPSEVTSLSAFLLASVFARAGLPPGVINMVFGDGLTTGAPLVAHGDVHGVSFTGGTATGVAIRRATVAQIYKHLSLELGGKNPTLVFADSMAAGAAGVRERTVRTAAMAAFENQGEICLCGSRIYVERAVYAEFVEAFTAFVEANYRVGEKVGAVVSLQHYAKVRGYLEIAQSQGMTFQTGEVPPVIQEGEEKGYWIKPTVLTEVPADSELLREEIFGPVVTIVPFEDEDEAVRLANDSEYGLASVLLTTDGGRMRRVGEQLQAGLVWVNTWLVRELGTPFGGMKNSGTGREGGEYSRDVFTVARTVHLATTISSTNPENSSPRIGHLCILTTASQHRPSHSITPSKMSGDATTMVGEGKALPPPMAFASWLTQNAGLLQPPVNNYCLFSGKDMVLMVVGGPNSRNDYHVNETEEWFYQLKGAMCLKVVETNPATGHGEFKDVHIKEGEMFLLPANTPHNPCRFENTTGLVMECVRPEGSLDRLRWYCKKGGHEHPTMIREEVFHCTDLGTQLKPLINHWRENESVRKCPECGQFEDPQ